MSILIGTSNVSEVLLGTSQVKEIWLGTSLAWQRGSTPWILFNKGPVNEITWEVNKFPLTTSGKATSAGLKTVGDEKWLQEAILNYGSQTTTTVHICTTAAVTIPSSAKKLYLSIRRDASRSAAATIKCGFILPEAENEYDVANGGYLWEKNTASLSKSEFSDIYFELDGHNLTKGAEVYHLIIGLTGYMNSARGININKIWFT